mmetsp:Transcript_30064/g.68028  ORF Transcript_30064/g.68028 Transcript_30064/m.68028 type:complete len:298 (+) Transcript_30064:6573-7466(+)
MAREVRRRCRLPLQRAAADRRDGVPAQVRLLVHLLRVHRRLSVYRPGARGLLRPRAGVKLPVLVARSGRCHQLVAPRVPWPRLLQGLHVADRGHQPHAGLELLGGRRILQRRVEVARIRRDPGKRVRGTMVARDGGGELGTSWKTRLAGVCGIHVDPRGGAARPEQHSRSRRAELPDGVPQRRVEVGGRSAVAAGDGEVELASSSRAHGSCAHGIERDLRDGRTRRGAVLQRHLEERRREGLDPSHSVGAVEQEVAARQRLLREQPLDHRRPLLHDSQPDLHDGGARDFLQRRLPEC